MVFTTYRGDYRSITIVYINISIFSIDPCVLKTLSKNVPSMQEVEPSACSRCGLACSILRWNKTVTSEARGKDNGRGCWIEKGGNV